MQWIKFYKKQVVRINLDDPNFRVISIDKTAVVKTTYGTDELTTSDIYWFRRPKLVSLIPSGSEFTEEYYFQAREETEALYTLYHWVMDNCTFIANPFTSSPNKIHQLDVAKKCGFLTPDTIFSTKKEDIESMFNKYSKLAVKPFSTLSISTSNSSCEKAFTTCIEKQDLDRIPKEFGGLIIQNYIEKKYELRSFFFNKEFYTMAIFSQNDDKTKIDFRNYNKEKPNKFVCFELAEQYKDKLLLIAEKLGLDTGSFDIIVDHEENYYFLEVNPIGQFGMVSHPCNYNIEKYIALSLIEKGENNGKQ
jgi:ATP-GRASP peptide maturase of grasp-with-spasm system